MKPHQEPRGTWRELGGRRCYVTGDAGDGPPLVLLPDAFQLEADTPATMLVGVAGGVLGSVTG